MTAQIVKFSPPYRPARHVVHDEPCSIMILPVVRNERPATPHDVLVAAFLRGRKRRRYRRGELTAAELRRLAKEEETR